MKFIVSGVLITGTTLLSVMTFAPADTAHGVILQVWVAFVWFMTGAAVRDLFVRRADDP